MVFLVRLGADNNMTGDEAEKDPFTNPTTGISFSDVEATQYLNGNSANVRQRFEVYKHARDGRSINQAVLEELSELSGDETIVDLGCSDAEMLLKIRAELGHRGRLIGVDMDDFSVQIAETTKMAGFEPIEFHFEDATSTSIEPESADRVLALFLLYHIDPEKGLKEIDRILKPGGKALIATSGEANKQRHRTIERYIAQSLGILPPNQFSEPFDADVAQEMLPQWFSQVRHVPHQSDMVIASDEALLDYMLSLQSMSSAFCPPLQRFGAGAVMEKLVEPKIRNEIERRGEFVDKIDRHLFICEKPV